MTKTALYRHFNADGELLYVGISLSAAKRLSKHMREQLWAYEVCRIEIEWFNGRDEAMIAEVAAIKGEAPKYNVVHKYQCKYERCGNVAAMLTPIPSNDEILSEIAAHCDKEGITMTEFSARCGNVAIVTRLKKGRSLSTAVFNRVAEVLRSAE